MIFYLEIYTGIIALCLLSKIADGIDKKLIIFAIFIMLVLIAGFRNEVGTDFPAYREFYYTNNPTSTGFEPAYLLIRAILKFFYLPSGAFFLLCSFITFFCFFKGFKIHSNDISLSIILLIGLGFYTSSFNIVRQFVALSIYFCFGLKYIKQKLFLNYLICVLIGSCFHLSIILMLPFYFIVNLNISTFYALILIVVAVLFNLGLLSLNYVSPLTQLLPAKYQGYFQFLEHYLETLNEPLWLKFINNADKLIVLFCLMKYKKKLLSVDPTNNVLINFYLINVIFLFVSRGLAELQRVGLYFNVVSLLVVPLLLHLPPKKWGKLLVYCIIVIAYSAYFALFVLNKNVGEVIPYRTVFE